MGAYGSPQLGAYANDNKRPAPKSPKPWGALIIALIITIGYQIYVNGVRVPGTDYRLSPSKIAENTTPEADKTGKKIEIKLPSMETKSVGILSNTMGTYLIEDKRVSSEIKNLLLSTVNGSRTGSINSISTQASINSLKESASSLEARKTEKAYDRYKEKTIATYTAALSLLENHLASGNTSYESMATLYNDFVREESGTYDILKELFDENGILYTETVEEGEGKQIRYQYAATY